MSVLANFGQLGNILLIIGDTDVHIKKHWKIPGVIFACVNLCKYWLKSGRIRGDLI